MSTNSDEAGFSPQACWSARPHSEPSHRPASLENGASQRGAFLASQGSGVKTHGTEQPPS